MAKVLAFFAEGTEEIECLTVVDILRRGGVDVDLVSITKNKEVCGSHKIRVVCDKTIDDADLDSAELLFLPGGIPGVPHLEENQIVIRAYQGFQEGIDGVEHARWTGRAVEVTKQIITGRGMGVAVDFALAVLEQLEGKEVAEKIKKGIQHPDTI